MRMRLIVSSYVVCLALPHFCTLSHKRQDFRKKVIEHKMCVLIFSTTFVRNISHSKNNSAKYYKRPSFLMESTRYSCQILIKREFSWNIF